MNESDEQFAQHVANRAAVLVVAVNHVDLPISYQKLPLCLSVNDPFAVVVKFTAPDSRIAFVLPVPEVIVRMPAKYSVA